MKLSELKKYCTGSIEIFRDADIDHLYLLGKEKKSKGKYAAYLLKPEYIPALTESDLDAVICPQEIKNEVADSFAGGICVSPEPKKTFFEFHQALLKLSASKVETAIAESAKINETAVIAPYNVFIGKNVIIGANCVIKENVEINDNCCIEDGCVLGTPAFYYFGEGDSKRLVESAGKLVLKTNVTIHSNTSVEKGVLADGATIIGKNTAIDNLCLIGHDSTIGEGCNIAAGTTLAGGVKIGNNCSTGVSVAFAPNVSVGDNVKLSIGAVVTKDIPGGEHYSGNFAVPHDKFLRFIKNLAIGGKG